MLHYLSLRFHPVKEGLPKEAGDYLFLDKTSNPMQTVHVRAIFEKFDRDGRKVYSYRDCNDGYHMEPHFIQGSYKYWFKIPSTLDLKVIEDRNKEKEKKGMSRGRRKAVANEVP